MSEHSFKRLLCAAVCALLLTLIQACSPETEASLLASARSHLEKKDLPAAAIQLKKLLQRRPASGEARYLLGRTLLQSGDARSAVVELQKARQLKYSSDDVLPKLAQALLAAGQPKAVTDNFAATQLGNPAADADLKGSLAVAYGAQGQHDRADAALAAGLVADPSSAWLRLLRARRLAAKGQFAPALALANEVSAEQPENVSALLLRGELLWVGNNDLDGAIAALAQVLALDPAHVNAHSLLIQIHVQRKDAARVKAQIAELAKAAPASLEALYYRTQQAAGDGDWKVAREGVQQLLKLAPTLGPVLHLAGSVALQSNELELATKHLTQAMAAMPDSPAPRRTMAMAQLRWGQVEKSLATLAPLLNQRAPDAAALGLAAEAYLQSGDMVRAQALYKQAAQADPGDSKPRVALVLAEMTAGGTKGGIEQLRGIAANDRATYADLALISALFGEGRFEEAAAAAQLLETKLPGKPLPHLLLARTLAAQKKLDQAYVSLERALALDPLYSPAVSDIAALELGRGKPEAARKRFEALLGRDPRNIEAELGLIELLRLSGAKPADLEKHITAVVGKHPAEPQLRLALIRYHLGMRQPQAALRAAQEAAAAMPQDPHIIGGLATALLATGDTQQAIVALRREASLQPNSAAPHLRLAEVYASRKEYAAAQQSFNAALEVSPGSIAAQRGLVLMELQRKQPDEALRIARRVQKQRPQEAIGHLLEADIHVARKAFGQAADAARVALDRVPGSEQAVRVHSLYLLAGRLPEAERLSADWLKKSPDDTAFLFHLGVAAMRRNELVTAEGLFRRVLAITPDNASSLNNVAYLLLKQQKPGALAYAEKAQARLPDNADIMDTLASALAAEKQMAKALEWQRKAAQKAPESPSIRLNLAKLLIDAGDKQQARAELDKLASLGGRFAGSAEVTALLKAL